MKDLQNRTLFLVGLMALAVVARLLPHPPNFSPLGALALFGGASLADRRLAFVLPLGVMLMSDLFLGLHSTLPYVYACLAFNVLLGRLAGNGLSVSLLIPAGLLGSFVFFLVTNFAHWFSYEALTWESLVACYVGAIPFYQNSLAGDAFFGCVLFGSLALAQAYFPSLKPAQQAAELENAALA